MCAKTIAKKKIIVLFCAMELKNKNEMEKKPTSARSARMLFLLHCDLFVHYLWMLS